MRIVGLLMAIIGWLVTVSSVEISSTLLQTVVALIGILIITLGVLGALNSFHLRTAIWKGKTT
jgi:hypothetical protein